MHIGLAGFGRMGAAMASRFAEQGHQLTVWNRSSGPAEVAAKTLGAHIVKTPTELTQNCDVVVSSLFNEQAVRAVYLEPHGLAHGSLDGRLLIDTSTMPPRLGQELASAVAAAGGRFVDAPVLGTVEPARKGELIALVGGSAVDAAEATITLSLISRAVHTLGPCGAGYAGKLAVNLIKATYWAALGDCLGLARRFGIEPSAILDVIESGPGALVELQQKMPVLRGMLTEPAFDIVGGVKDLLVMVEAGGGGDAVPVAAGALRAMQTAVEGGWGNRDIASVGLFAAAQIAARNPAVS